MKILRAFAWFFLVMTFLSMIGITLLLLFIFLLSAWHPIFFAYMLNIAMGIPLILILLDYLKLSKVREV